MIFALDIIVIGALIAIAVIDARHMIIPDSLSLLVGIAAALSAYLGGTDRMIDAMAGSLIALILFEGTRRVMTWRLKHEAMGFGDVKLMAAGGLWVGAGILPLAIMLACGAALIGFAIRNFLLRREDHDQALPFGPYLAAGLILAKAWNDAAISLDILP